MPQAETQEREQSSQSALPDEAEAALKRLESKDPGLRQFLKKKAYAYAIFPSVGKAAAVVGGGYGRGVIFEQGEPVGYATISKLTLGVDLGGGTFIELIAFENRDVLKRFKRGKYAFDADASVILVKAGASATANFEKGAVTFAYASGGLKLEAAIGGQKFKFKPMSDEEDRGEEHDRDEDESDEGEEGPSLRERADAGLKAIGHLQKAATGGKIRKAFSLWGAARQLKVAAAGAKDGGKKLMKRHPVASALVVGGVAAGAVLFAASRMGAFAADQPQDADNSSASESDDADRHAEDECEAEEPQDAGASHEDDDEQGDDRQDEEDVPRRSASRRRARA